MVSSNFQERTFDAYAHIFFADHYRRAWFNFWEPRWYGGFYITTYPPLAHQILALLSFIIGDLEYSYQVLTFLLMITLPIAVYGFSRIFVSEEDAEKASIISVFCPSILTTTYIFGQFTTLFALVLLLLSAGFFNLYTETNKKLDLLIASGLLISSFCSHNFTTVFFAPIFLSTIILAYGIKGNKKMMKPITLIVTICFIISAFILLPFLHFILSGQTQKPIPHASRTNFFTNWQGFAYFFLLMYGPIVFFLPLAVFRTIRSGDRKKYLLLAVASFLFILGLGGTTPIPAFLFGKYWELLTYDRFSLWSTIMFLPLLASTSSETLRNGRSILSRFNILFLLLIIFSSIICGVSFRANGLYLPRKIDLTPLIEFLNADENWKWRYLTLGFGGAQLAKLSSSVKATTVDGFYVWARSDPILRNSGIETLDGAKYWKNGLEVLNEVLSNSLKYKIKFVFCNDPFYYDILRKNGFSLLFSQENTRDYRLGGVTIWVNNKPVPKLSEEEFHIHEKISINNYLWGILPPLIFLITLFLLGLRIYYFKSRNLTTQFSFLINENTWKNIVLTKKALMHKIYFGSSIFTPASVILALHNP